MKRVTSYIFVCLLVGAMLAGCGNSTSNPSASAAETSGASSLISESSTPVGSESSVAESSAESEPASSDAVNNEVSIDDLLMAIEATYGDAYPAKMAIPAEVLETEFGLTPDLYTEAKGGMAAMSVHNDRVVIAKAAPDKADALEQAFKDARQRKIDSMLEYPANMMKTNAAKVVRHGDYVAFLMVGVPNPDQNVTNDSPAAKEYAEAQVQKAVDAFNSVFVA